MIIEGARVTCSIRLYDRGCPMLWSVEPGTVGEVIDVGPATWDGAYLGYDVVTIAFGMVIASVNSRLLTVVKSASTP